MPTTLARAAATSAMLLVWGLTFVVSSAAFGQADKPPQKPAAPAAKAPAKAAPKAGASTTAPKSTAPKSDAAKPAAPAAPKTTTPKTTAPKPTTPKPAAPKTDTPAAPKKTVPATETEDEKPAVDVAEEEKKEQVAADRFLSVLEKNPRRGTALDKVYGFHVERGTLDKWLKGYRDRIAKDEKDGTAWMVLALIEAHRGQDAAAVKAFQKAEQYLPDSPMASYYLGQSLVLVGQPDLAAAAFERAIERKPPQVDLLDIFQALGRVYQRAQRADKALEVWNRLEKLFPNDLRVQEQIAQTLVEEGQPALALPRFEGLAAKTTKDLYRQSQFRIQVAEIKVRLGKSKEGIDDFEKQLSQLNPDNWLYRDVRHKIDEVFLRTDDQAGLATYYEGWVAKHPEDVDAMARLARILATQGRAPESQKWLEKGLKLAPSRKELRMAIIDQLVFDQKYADAIKQYELLDKQEPYNTDTIREWGRLILKDTSRTEADRKKTATALWVGLVESKPKDPVVVTQVADLFRHAEITDEALKLYKKAIELAPDAPQYREYLGEYYHQLKRPDEALATWRQIIAGSNRTAPNLARLAEVLIGFGYLAEGTQALADAVKLDPKDFDLRLRLARAFNKGEKYDDSLQQLAEAHKLAANAEESEAVLKLDLENYVAGEKLETQIAALEKGLDPAKADPQLASKWYLLARYYEAGRKLPEALKAIKKSLELDSQSVPTLSATARLYESSNTFLDAAETYRKLAVVDRRFRTEYLTNVAKLETRLGRRAEALQAGRDVIASAPGNPDSYEFFAQLCFQLGENDEGLETLRRSVRVNPSDPKVVLGLANALSEQFKTAEAIELFWRAFEKDAEVDGKLDIINKLTELYLRTNHLDRLLERLERERREDSQQQRIMTLCIAQAHQAAGDFGTARAELERMLSPETRDTPLLQQLAKLAEAEGDYPSAIKYQERLIKLAPSKEQEMQLAHYLTQSGDNEQAGQLMVKIALDEKDPDKLLKSVDSLLQREQKDEAMMLLERMRRDQPRNWEYMYREGTALFAKQPDAALARFQEILDLNLPDEEMSQAAKTAAKQPPGKRVVQTRNVMMSNPVVMRYSQRSQAISSLREVTGLETRYRYYNQGYFWGPSDYGSARMAAYAWMLSAAQKKGQQDQFIKEQRAKWEMSKTSTRASWDWYYLQALRGEPAETYQAAKALVMLPSANLDAQFMYLTSLSSRAAQNPNVPRRVSNSTTEDTTPPLPEDELKLVLSLYQKTIDDPQLTDLMQSYYGSSLVDIVSTELKRAKREDEGKKLFDEALARAKSPDQLRTFLGKAAQDADYPQFMKLWDLLAKMPPQNGVSSTQQFINQYGSYYIPRMMAGRAEAKELGDVMSLADKFLTSDFESQKIEATSGKPRNKNFNNPYGAGQRPYYQIWLSKNNTDHSSFEFPTPNAHFDYYAILVLRNAFVLYQQADKSAELVKHYEELAKKENLSPTDRLPWQLAVAYLHWWSEAQDVALKEMQAISAAVPEDQDFKLELAELYGSRNEFGESLEMLNAITPLDQEVMQRRENMALKMAIQLGDTERAREAAARLFGLRLDAETQVQLASQMKQLGMHEQAEAVMARAGRQAGNRMGALISLMREFQAQGKTDTALQIAQTILRRTQARPSSSGPYSSGRDANSQYRQQAVQFLVDSGKLKELIERTESQLKNSPKSTALHQTLMEFYTASGDKDKARDIAVKLAELNQNDPAARWNIAKQLLQAGEVDKAVEHFAAAMKAQPRLFTNEYWEVQNAFRRAKKTAELVKILEQIDLKQLGQSYVVSNIIQELIREEASRKTALQLLKRAWDAFPQERSNMLSSIYEDSVWELPEMYDYARQAFVPQEGVAQSDPWAGFDIRSYSSDGTVSGSLHHMLLAAKKQNKVAELEKEITAALAKTPTWSGGKAMLAVLQIQRGDQAGAVKAFQEIIDNKDKGLPGQAAWLLAQELKTIPKSDDLAIKFYEIAYADPNNGINSQFQYSPGSALVGIYEKAGQKDKARDVLIKAAAKKTDARYDQQYQAYMRIQSEYEIGERLRKLGYPIDAIKLFNRILLDTAGVEMAKQYGGREYTSQAKKGLETALASIDQKQIASGMKALLQPGEEAIKDPQAPAVDLFLSVSVDGTNSGQIISLLVNILQKVAQQPGTQTELVANLQQLQSERPDDLSVRVLICAVQAAQDEAFTKSVTELDQWVTAHPLEALPDGKRASTRQREVAAWQMPLWLIARECLKKESLREIGKRLSNQALDGARRQVENTYMVAMTREAGQMAWDSGDTATAEARWSEMLDLIMVRPGIAKAGTATPAVPVPAVPGTPAPGARKLPVPPATLAQFNLALSMAKLVEPKKLHELSFKAIRTVFRGGPPIEIDPNTAANGRVIRQNDPSTNNIDVAVANGIFEIDQLWSQNQAPPDQVYAVLHDIVLPEARVDEVLLYPRPLPGGERPDIRSVGLMLAQRAIAAKKVDELRAQLEKLAGAPKSEFNSQMLLTLLALETKDIPRAKASFELLGKMADRYQNQNASELLCHVALPAIDNEELIEAAQPLLLRAIKTLSTGNRGGSDRLGALMLRLARLEFKKGKSDSGKKLLGDYLKAQDAMYTDYGGDYPQYMHKRAIVSIAGELAKAGQLEDAMQKLGEAADMPKFANYGDSDDGSSTASVLKQLEAKSPEDQYRILKAWTMPVAGRKTLRSIAKLGPSDAAPEAFLKGLLMITGRPATEKKGLESSIRLLIQSAQKVNKLDELAAEVQSLVEQKVPNAREFLTLIKIAQKKGKEAESDVKVMMNEIRSRQPSDETRRTMPWNEFLVTTAALSDPDLKATGQELAQTMINYSQAHSHGNLVPHLRNELNTSRVSDFPGAKNVGGTDPGLKWWRAGIDESAYAHAQGWPPVWWAANDGLVSHLGGPDSQYLYFRYPLAGKFEFSVDAYYGGWSEGFVGWAGLEFQGYMGADTGIFTHGGSESMNRPAGPRFDKHFLRQTFQIDQNKFRYLVNNVLIYEDNDASPNTPWLAIGCGHLQKSVFRNFKITGQPTVPRELHLVTTDRLEGWLSHFYFENQPPRRTIGKPERYDANRIIARDPNPHAYDWAAQDGVIHGRKVDGLAPATAQSRLYYHRPLDDGDTLTYEFLYEPGTTHVHPALDRLAFLLEPDGVRLHWMTDGARDLQPELAHDNVIDVPAERRGNGGLPLQPNDWNKVKIELQLPTVRIELNGQPIYEAQLDAANRRQFGLYHDKSKTMVKVRNVVMTGNWPEQLSPEILSNLLAPDDTPLSVADRHARHAIIGEQFYLLESPQVIAHARKLPPAERYDYLANWVLPSDGHPTYRLLGEFTPVDQPPTAELLASVDKSIPRPHSGGQFQSAVYELVAAAKALDKVDELRRKVEGIPGRTEADKRGKLTVLALINLELGRWNVADAQLSSLYDMQRQLPPQSTILDRWPDVLVAYAASAHPESRFQGRRMLQEAMNRAIANNPGDEWDRWVRLLKEQADAMAEQQAWEAAKYTPPALRQWNPVSAGWSQQRALGLTPGRWRFLPGELHHHSGSADDFIYFQSPLKGDFELECDLSTWDWREMDPMYAGQYISLLYTLNEVRVGRVGGALSNGILEQQVKNPGNFYRYKLTVKDGNLTIYANEDKIRERRLPADFDPWLGFHSFGVNWGTVRNVRITGSPTIPSDIDLLGLDALADAWYGYYNPSGQKWKKELDELRSDKTPDRAGRKEETLLQYHRQMVEDGEIEYEFFYEAGATAVHPALDRMTLLVEPDGVNLHWVTDQEVETTLPAGNVTTEKENRRGPEKLPLKNADWNKILFKLTGNTVILSLNGVEIYQRELEPTNQRIFGLFHFSDETQARVRNIHYRGNWPKTLPSLADQEMAVGAPVMTKKDLPYEVTWNAQRKNPAPFNILGDSVFVELTPKGLKTDLPAGADKPMVGVQLIQPIAGDFEATVVFSGLKAQRPANEPDDAGPGIDLNIFINAKHQEWLKFERRITKDLRELLLGVHGEIENNDRQMWHVPQFNYIPPAQQLRIIRKGGMAYYLVAPHGSKEFQLVDRRLVGTEPLEKIEFLTRAFSKPQSAAAVLEEFTVRTQNPLKGN